jgi:hypothetical protein
VGSGRWEVRGEKKISVIKSQGRENALPWLDQSKLSFPASSFLKYGATVF